MRHQLMETRSKTASLRMVIDQQQRESTQALTEFQKAKNLAMRRPQTGPQRVELAPDSLQTLAKLLQQALAGEAIVLPAVSNAAQAAGRCLERLPREYASKAEASRSLQTLVLILRNLLADPTVQKYRRVNADSARFQGSLGASGAARELLELAGFARSATSFLFPQERGLEEARCVCDQMQEVLQRWLLLPERPWPPEGAGAAPELACPSQAEGASAPLVPAPPKPSPWLSSVMQKQLAQQTLRGAGSSAHLAPAAAEPQSGG